MSDIRDFSGKNRKFTGTSGIKLPSGSEAQRVNEQAQLRFNTDTNLAEYYDGTDWKPIDAPPTITGFTLDGGSSVTSTFIDRTAGGNASIVISGSNFDTTSGTVVFEPEGGGSNVTTQTITRTNSSSFTVTVTRSDFVEANDPYAIKLTNGSGLAATLASALDVNVPPVFNTAAGALANAYNGQSYTADAGATDADSDTITFSITSGALPSGLSISSSTGAITGTPSATAGTFNITVTAATSKGNSTRDFSIALADLPSGGTTSIVGSNRIHSFTSNGTLSVPAGFTASDIDVLIVAGGGGGGAGNGTVGGEGSGGGGGGAGGLVYFGPAENSSPNNQVNLAQSTNYSIVVGSGGSRAPDENSFGNNGGNSTAFGYTALGGGAGNSHENTTPSRNGGSGAGNHDRNNGSRPQGTQNSTYGYGYGSDGGLGQGLPTDGEEAGAGGGGAGGQGEDVGGPNDAGNGGVGKDYSSVFGTSFGESGYFAGGGGGGSGQPNTYNNFGVGGNGGGGNGGYNGASAQQGVDGTGGGGGGGIGGGSSLGGDGGNGIVLIRYAI